MSLTIEEVNKLKAAPVEGMLPVLANRWSPRSFNGNPIPENDIKIILEAARWTASSSNEQPWRFLVGVNGSPTHKKIFDSLVGANQTWAVKPYLLILGFTMLKDSKGNTNRYAIYDLGQAVVSLITQANALGLKTHSMGGFDHDAVRHAFNLTEDYGVGAVIAIGHQDEPGALPAELEQREIAPRQRKPLSLIALTELETPFEI